MNRSQATHIRVGVDIGGTFTDFVLIDLGTGRLSIGKTLTTPSDPSVAVVQGLQRLLRENGLRADQVEVIIHGTTLATNALIERKGARAGLITTAGFRDVLEIARERRYDSYDVMIDFPEPLVPRFLRLEVGERLDKDGQVVQPLATEEAVAAIEQLRREGVAAIAVSFLHAFRNPAHERVVKELIAARAPGIFASISSEVVPEIREYERTSTTVVNAYVQPIMQRYLDKLAEDLAELGYRRPVFMMLSSGGIASAEVAGRFPVRIIESGPAAGAIATTYFGDQTGFRDAISFDVGGTTAKICLIDQGQPLTVTDFEVARVHWHKRGSGVPINVPMIEMIEIGTGGGSIARVDAMGLLKVGPHSAGASPGPACYRLGGTAPTVTDADLLLGYLDAGYFLGGEMALDGEAARRALEETVARPLGLTVTQAAWGVHEVVNENMASAIKMHALEKGRDPRKYALFAFGGAGPVHAFDIARRLGIRQIIYPLAAGVTSSFGFLVAPISFELARGFVAPLEGLDFSAVDALLGELEAEGARLLGSAGVPREEVEFLRTCSMSYIGQGFEIGVPVPGGGLGPEQVDALREAFHARHEQLYGRSNPGLEIKVVAWRVTARGPKPEIGRNYVILGTGTLADARKGTRPAYFPAAGDYVECEVYDRYRLPAGATFEGPAIVEERESTVVLGPGARVRVDDFNNLIVSLRDEGASSLSP